MEIPDVGHAATMPVFVRKLARMWADREFLVTPVGAITYNEFERSSRRIAKDLVARGAGKGSRIGFIFGNSHEWVLTWMAVTRIGAIAMAFPTTYRPAELRKALLIGDVDTLVVPPTLFGHDQLAFVEDAIEGLTAAHPPLRLPSTPCLRSVLVTSRTDRDWAEVIDVSPGSRTHANQNSNTAGDAIDDEMFEAIEAQVHPSDPMQVIFTSGTTAEPKGVVHSHGTYIRHAKNIAEANDVEANQRVFGGMPFFWIGGVSHMLGPVMHLGNTYLCTAKFDAAEAVDLIERQGATSIAVFPNMAQRLRDHVTASGRTVEDIPALAPPPPRRVGPERVTSSLGMTETCAAYIASGPRNHIIPEEYAGAFGFPVPMSQYRIADLETGATLGDGVEGEICVRGYSLMLGMCKRERHEVFDDDGWYHTGDKGFSRGPYLYFTGRAKDLIKTAGANVAPREVEVVLNSFPEVLMSVVVGLSDAERGEIVGAVVVPNPSTTVDPTDLVTRVNAELSSYKVPRRILLVAEADVPYLGTGKPDRLALKEQLETDGAPVTPTRS
jgi:acyl-CoA synthetase (AMP-forming)/AMP-acid ligase II